MPQEGRTRRDVLQAGGSIASAGMLVGLAGCSQQSGGTTTDSENSQTTGSTDSSGGNEGAPGSKVRQVEMIVTTADYDPIRYEFGQMIAENWRKLGLNVKTNPMAWNKLVDTALVGQNFDTYTLNWAGRAERIDPDHFTYSIFHSSQTEEGEYNFVNYTNDEYDKYAEQQRATYDQAARKKAVFKCQEIAMSDQPHTPIANKEQVMPYNSARFKNPRAMMGEGLMAFWNMVDIEPKQGVKTLRLGYPSDVNNLNPLNLQATHDAQTMRLIYDRLFRVTPDGVPEPWAAKKMEKENDTTFRVTLRDGMKWHDGKEVTADDVKFTYDYVTDHSPKLGAFAEPVKSVEKVDNLTVRFNLKRPFAPFVANTLGTVFILPQHIWKDVPKNVDVDKATQWANAEVIGSGPFKFGEWRRQEQMSLLANKDHFHAPKVDELLKVPGSSMQTLVRLFENEQIDMIGWVPQPNTQDRLKSLPFASLSSKASHGFYHINYKCNEKPFDDVAFRRALAYAIPKQDIVDTLLNGRGTVAHSMIAKVNNAWHNPNVEKFNFSMDNARQELKDAGYTWDSNDKLHYPK